MAKSYTASWRGQRLALWRKKREKTCCRSKMSCRGGARRGDKRAEKFHAENTRVLLTPGRRRITPVKMASINAFPKLVLAKRKLSRLFFSCAENKRRKVLLDTWYSLLLLSFHWGTETVRKASRLISSLVRSQRSAASRFCNLSPAIR